MNDLNKTNLEVTELVKLAYSKPSRFGINEGNKIIYEDNSRIFNDWHNGIDPYNLGDFNEFMNNTILYDKEFNVNDITKTYDNTTFGVINADCIDVAKHLLDKGSKCAILNLASLVKPCGGYDSGLKAQEENLCRASNLSQSLYQFQFPYRSIKTKTLLARIEKANVKYRGYGYPLDLNFGGIYSKDVTFFRSNAKNYYKPLDKPFKCDVITVAALSFTKSNKFHNDELQYKLNDNEFTEEGNEIQLNKIRTILRIALANGDDSIVLGAFGCGVYQLPIKEVVKQFKTVFNEVEFKNKFKRLIFAIMSRSDETKFQPFYDEFGTYTM